MGGFYGSLVRGAPGLEVGDAVGSFINWVSGADKKAERTAKANRDAAIAQAEAAAAAERTAQLQLQLAQAQGGQGGQSQAQKPAAGFLTQKAGPLPVWGWALAALGVGGTAYFLLRDDGRRR